VKHRFTPKKPPALMLTSLLDMFTIILIFLIVSFSNEDYNFKLNKHLKLPDSDAHSVFKPAVNMAVTEQAVIVEKKQVYKLDNGRADPADYDAGEIVPVVNALEKYYKEKKPGDDAKKDAADDTGDDSGSSADQKKDTTIVLIQADKGLDYKTLYLVMRSARLAGFARYRLAIMKK